jgi:phosphatidate cytidylyltransferase
MKRVLTAVVLIPVVLFLVFLGPRWQWLFTVAVAAVAGLAGWEFMGLAEHGGFKPPRVAVLVAMLALFAANFQWPDRTAAFFCLFSLGLLVYCTFLKPVEQVMADASASVFCLVYIGFTLITLPALREEANGPSLVTFLLCVVWAGDTAALYVGRAWGRGKLAPRLSPNKTWAGAVASMAGSLIAVGVLLGLAGSLQQPWSSDVLSWLQRSNPAAVLLFPDEPWYWLLVGAAVNVAAQVGDLSESALKRSVGVKDSGTLLPGHGGVLDRIDALLLAAPALWYAQVIHQIL